MTAGTVGCQRPGVALAGMPEGYAVTAVLISDDFLDPQVEAIEPLSVSMLLSERRRKSTWRSRRFSAISSCGVM